MFKYLRSYLGRPKVELDRMIAETLSAAVEDLMQEILNPIESLSTIAGLSSGILGRNLPLWVNFKLIVSVKC